MQRDLVVAAMAEDRDGFTSLAAASVDRLYRVAYRILRDPDDARDYESQTGTCSTAEDWVPTQAAVGDRAVREIYGRFVGLGVVDGTRGIVLSLRPTVIQPTREQITEDGALFDSIIASFATD